jgi:hypothetical protein
MSDLTYRSLDVPDYIVDDILSGDTDTYIAWMSGVDAALDAPESAPKLEKLFANPTPFTADTPSPAVFFPGDHVEGEGAHSGTLFIGEFVRHCENGKSEIRLDPHQRSAPEGASYVMVKTHTLSLV